MTINNDHVISKVIALCGGINAFGALDRLVPQLTMEAVLTANPETILAGGMGEENQTWLTDWRRFPALLAVQRNNLFFVPPSLLQRPTPRLLQGAALVCQHLDTARAKRNPATQDK
jgi:iron complex transport system substrate-binding protein